MTPIEVTVEVERPVPEVFAFTTDPTKFALWQRGVVSGHMDSTEPARPGTRCLTTRQIGWAKRAVTAEVTRIDPPTHWSVRGVDGPIRAAVDVTVTSLAPDRSRVVISLDFTGHGIGRALVPLVVRRQARREMPKNAADLKRRLESTP